MSRGKQRRCESQDEGAKRWAAGWCCTEGTRTGRRPPPRSAPTTEGGAILGTEAMGSMGAAASRAASPAFGAPRARPSHYLSWHLSRADAYRTSRAVLDGTITRTASCCWRHAPNRRCSPDVMRLCTTAICCISRARIRQTQAGSRHRLAAPVTSRGCSAWLRYCDSPSKCRAASADSTVPNGLCGCKDARRRGFGVTHSHQLALLTCCRGGHLDQGAHADRRAKQCEQRTLSKRASGSVSVERRNRGSRATTGGAAGGALRSRGHSTVVRDLAELKPGPGAGGRHPMGSVRQSRRK